MTVKAKIRLYVDAPLGKGQSLSLSRDQAHYLTGVMRQKAGAMIALFNGQDGEWQAELVEAGKRKAVLVCVKQSKPQKTPPDVWLYFAPIKKTRTDFIVEKAAELGASRIFPVQTDFTNADRIRQDRLQAHAVEAAEQCGETYVPPVAAMQKLDSVLAKWPEDRKLLFCDETLVGDMTQGLQGNKGGKWAILIGPEGGFSEIEITRLRSMKATRSISLGPRVLRADTAAVAALALWQNALGIGDEFVRPPIAAHFSKWHEAYFVVAILLFGTWMYLYGAARLNLIMQGLGLVVSLVGIILLRTTIQRIRFQLGQKAPGIVDVTEREISYFGPMHGKTISLDSLNKIELRESEAYAAIWVLHHSDGDPMIVPTTAKGSGRLFDAFASLSGVKMDMLVSAINQTPIQVKVIWQRG